jgi:hypothetical protein
MARRNWAKIARNEFDSMDQDEQASFADLYDKVNER